MQTKRKAGLLIVFLLITVAMAVAFFPSVNSNVAEGLSSITAIDESSLDGATQTIFDSISYARSIHILAMLLVGFGFLMVFLRGHEFTSLTATFLAVSIAVPVYLLVKSFLPGEFEVMNISGFLFAEFAAASLLICMGAVLGRLKMEQSPWLTSSTNGFCWKAACLKASWTPAGPWPSTPSGLTLAWALWPPRPRSSRTSPAPRQTRSATNSACWAA